MFDLSTCQVVERELERISGAWIFRGRRVPISTLIENPVDGASVTKLF